MNKPKLYIMVGISASGKSTIAKQIAEKENCIIVSSDAIRSEICPGGVSDQSKNEEVFKIFHRRIRENLLKGNNVICDATNITIRSRRAIFNTVRNIDCYKIGYIVVKKIEDCIKDNKNSDRVDVPDEVIYRQIGKFQIPFDNEGFDYISFINSDTYQIIENYFFKVVNDMEGFNQLNPHHNQTLDEHCNFVYKNFCKKYDYPYPYRLAAMVHDYGKMFVQSFDEDNIAHYYSHENYGTYILLSNYLSLCSDETLNDVEILDFLFLINYHMLPIKWDTEKSKEKWRKIFGDYRYQLLVDFNKCDKARPVF